MSNRTLRNEITGDDFISPLTNAVVNKDADATRRLLAVIDVGRDEDILAELGPMYYAVLHSTPEIIEILLQHGVKAKRYDVEAAIDHNLEAVIALFLRYKESVDFSTAIEIAVICNAVGILSALVPEPAVQVTVSPQVLRDAIMDGNTEVVRVLAARTVPGDPEPVRDGLALLKAIFDLNYLRVQHMLEAKRYPEEFLDVAALLATRQGLLQYVKVILHEKSGACTAVFLVAVKSDRDEIVNFLLDADASYCTSLDVSAEDNYAAVKYIRHKSTAPLLRKVEEHASFRPSIAFVRAAIQMKDHARVETLLRDAPDLVLTPEDVYLAASISIPMFNALGVDRLLALPDSVVVELIRREAPPSPESGRIARLFRVGRFRGMGRVTPAMLEAALSNAEIFGGLALGNETEALTIAIVNRNTLAVSAVMRKFRWTEPVSKTYFELAIDVGFVEGYQTLCTDEVPAQRMAMRVAIQRCATAFINTFPDDVKKYDIYRFVKYTLKAFKVDDTVTDAQKAENAKKRVMVMTALVPADMTHTLLRGPYMLQILQRFVVDAEAMELLVILYLHSTDVDFRYDVLLFQYILHDQRIPVENLDVLLEVLTSKFKVHFTEDMLTAHGLVLGEAYRTVWNRHVSWSKLRSLWIQKVVYPPPPRGRGVRVTSTAIEDEDEDEDKDDRDRRRRRRFE